MGCADFNVVTNLTVHKNVYVFHALHILIHAAVFRLPSLVLRRLLYAVQQFHRNAFQRFRAFYVGMSFRFRFQQYVALEKVLTPNGTFARYQFLDFNFLKAAVNAFDVFPDNSQ